MGRVGKQPALPPGGYVLPGARAWTVMLIGIVLAGCLAAFAAWYQSRYDVAHDLYQVGRLTEAHDAEVYYSCGRNCNQEMRAIVDFADGPRTVDLPEISFDRRGLPERQWVPAPEPYSGTFSVYYDPERPQDTSRIRSQDEVEGAFFDDPRPPWIAVGVLVIWSLAWVRPALRKTGGSVRVLSSASASPGQELARYDGRTPDVVAAAGLITVGLGILLFSGSAWNSVVAMHLDESGAVAEGSDAAVRVVSDAARGGPVADKVFAEIVIKHVTVANEIVPVELVVPNRRVSSELSPGWYENIVPYTDGVTVKYDPANPDLAIAVADIEEVARPSALVVPVVLVCFGAVVVVWAYTWPVVRRRRSERSQQQTPPGITSGGIPRVDMAR